jgi:hypothetical protein
VYNGASVGRDEGKPRQTQPPSGLVPQDSIAQWRSVPSSGPHACRATLSLGVGYFEMGSHFLPGLASNCDPPSLSLPSSKGYRQEPPAPNFILFLRWGLLISGWPPASASGVAWITAVHHHAWLSPMSLGRVGQKWGINPVELCPQLCHFTSDRVSLCSLDWPGAPHLPA